MSMGNHPYTSRPLWFPGQSRRLVQWPVAGSVPKSASGFKLTPTGKHGRIAIELLEASSADHYVRDDARIYRFGPCRP
jgi:hypothetical protein